MKTRSDMKAEQFKRDKQNVLEWYRKYALGFRNVRSRIEALTGWDKDADDILKEINPTDTGMTIEITNFHRDPDGANIRAYWSKGITGENFKNFKWTTQCSKLRAFKDALLWLLDKSGIEKDNSKEIAELREQLAKIQTQVDEMEGK